LCDATAGGTPALAARLSRIVQEPLLIVQVPRGSAVARQLKTEPPPSLDRDEVVVETMATDADGNLEAVPAGEVVLSVPSPEALAREPEEVRRVITRAGTGVEPLVLLVAAAEELREEEVSVVLEAAGRSSRPVILRIVREA
jgi:hypothetical protein